MPTERAVQMNADPLSTEAQATSKGRILVVDDDRLVLATVTHGLAQAGYEVIDADNGDDAILLAREQRPELALLDIRMEGKSGFDVAEVLRDVYRIPFMFLSAFADAATLAQVESLGAVAYMIKPLDVGQILPTVDAAFGRLRAGELISLAAANDPASPGSAGPAGPTSNASTTGTPGGVAVATAPPAAATAAEAVVPESPRAPGAVPVPAFRPAPVVAAPAPLVTAGGAPVVLAPSLRPDIRLPVAGPRAAEAQRLQGDLFTSVADPLVDPVPLAIGVLMHRHSLPRAVARQRLQRMAAEAGLSEGNQAERLLAALEELARS
jgi:response regulator NasT